jgi:hypothetical protein
VTRDGRRLFRSDLKTTHVLLGKLPGVRAIDPDTTMNPRRSAMRVERNQGFGRLAPTAITGLLVLTVAACGGSAAAAVRPSVDAPATSDTATNPVDPGLPSKAPSAATVTTVDVGKEAWFAGFHITFGTATAKMKSGHGSVDIEAKFENTGDDSSRLDATISLVSAGQTAQEIEDPAAGSYVLLVREGNETGETPFTIG